MNSRDALDREIARYIAWWVTPARGMDDEETREHYYNAGYDAALKEAQDMENPTKQKVWESMGFERGDFWTDEGEPKGRVPRLSDRRTNHRSSP